MSAPDRDIGYEHGLAHRAFNAAYHASRAADRFAFKAIGTPSEATAQALAGAADSAFWAAHATLQAATAAVDSIGKVQQ